MNDAALLEGISQCPFASMFAPNRTVVDTEKKHIVVGDRFKQQFPQEQLLSISEAEQILARGEHVKQALTLLVGQGIPYQRLEQLYEAAKSHDHVTVLPPAILAKATRKQTHKHESSNIVISQPVARGDGTYRAQLLLDEACADISDHLTGQHIPGMLVVEAARQMMIAVAENFFIFKEAKEDSRFVTDKLEISYADFLLPLPVEIHYIPLAMRRAGIHNIKASCEIEFKQSSRTCARAHFDFSVIKRDYLEFRESELVDKVVQDALAQA